MKDIFRVPPLVQHWFSMTFPWPKMKIHDLSAQHIFPSKWYTTYECISELVVTVPSAHSTIVKKIKRFIIWLYKWSRVTFTELLSAVVKIPWHYHHFPWLSMTRGHPAYFMSDHNLSQVLLLWQQKSFVPVLILGYQTNEWAWGSLQIRYIWHILTYGSCEVLGLLSLQ